MSSDTEREPREGPPPDFADTPPGAIYASLAGSIFGSVCWMPIMAAIARDYLLGLATIAFALLVYAVSVRAALRAPRQFFRIEIVATAAVGAWTVAVVNWKWAAWMEAYRRTSTYEPMADLPLWAMNILLAALYFWIFTRFVQLDRRHRQCE